MEVLIVHDRRSMREKICDLLGEAMGQECHLTQAQDIREARLALTDKTFDLMILDLTMPNHVGRDRPSFNQVSDFLREVYDFEDLNAPGDLIGISQEADSLQLLASGLGPHFMVAITEDDDGIWQKHLIDRVRYALRSASSKQKALAKHFDVDAMIVTAMDEEFAPYRQLFELKPDRSFPEVNRFVFTDKAGYVRSGVGFSIGSSGQATAASRTQSLIGWFRPRIAIMSGYCGGVLSKVDLGDLCFFESAAPWDYGKWEETRDDQGQLISERFLPRPNSLTLRDNDVRLIARGLVDRNGEFSPEEQLRINQLSPQGQLSPKTRLTHAASGSAVVANDRIIEQIKGLNDAIRAVDMEAYGFYDACINTFVTKPKFMCLKSVSDYCNGEKGDDFHQVCSYISAVTTRRIITQYIDF